MKPFSFPLFARKRGEAYSPQPTAPTLNPVPEILNREGRRVLGVGLRDFRRDLRVETATLFQLPQVNLQDLPSPLLRSCFRFRSPARALHLDVLRHVEHTRFAVSLSPESPPPKMVVIRFCLSTHVNRKEKSRQKSIWIALPRVDLQDLPPALMLSFSGFRHSG